MLAVAGAHAANPSAAPLTLIISPAVIDLDTNRPAILPVITVKNPSDVAFRLTVFPAMAGQAVEGGLELRRGLVNDLLAHRALRLTAPRRVGAHSTVEIHPQFRTFAGRITLSIAAVVVGVPVRVPRGSVRFRLRLLGALFIHRLRAAPARPVIGSVGGTQTGSRKFDLVARVNNRGLKPAFITKVRFRVIDRTGNAVASVAGSPGFILPRAFRNFRAQLSHRFAPGRYRLEAIVRWATNETRRSGSLVAKVLRRPAGTVASAWRRPTATEYTRIVAALPPFYHQSCIRYAIRISTTDRRFAAVFFRFVRASGPCRPFDGQALMRRATPTARLWRKIAEGSSWPCVVRGVPTRVIRDLFGACTP